MRTIFSFLAACCVLALHAQVDSVAIRYGATITARDLQQHLEILAGDAYEGRETGYKGQKMAAEYLQQQFRSFGIGPIAGKEDVLLNGYQQSFPLRITKLGGLKLQVPGMDIRFLKDDLYFNEKIKRDWQGTGLVVTTPEGLDKVGRVSSGKALLVMDELGGKQGGNWLFTRLAELSGSASTNGAEVILLATSEMPGLAKDLGHYLQAGRMQLADRKEEATTPGPQIIVIDRPVADHLLKAGRSSWSKALRRARKGPLELEGAVALAYHPDHTELSGENVLAYIEGSDRKDEVVVITAHYDHIGVMDGEVYNGADDDGSGTVALLEIAQAFAKAKAAGNGPRRSVLVMPVSGEEKGLLGSEYYSEHPVFPLENTVADLNIDMIGRVDTIHGNGAPYVYVIGSDRLSSALHEANERANRAVGLELDYRFNAEDDPNRFYYRSDHYNFAKKGIPSIFYFNGVHADYHGPHDEVDKIRYDLLEMRTRLVFLTAWDLANRPDRIQVDRPVKE